MHFFLRTFFLVIAIFFAFCFEIFSQNTKKLTFPSFKDFKNETFRIEKFKNWFDSITHDEKYSYKIESETNDEMGFKHIKINQYYNNLIIENAVYILHTRNDLIESVSGYLYTNTPISNKPIISLETAKRKITKKETKSITSTNQSPKYIENKDGKIILCYEFLMIDKLNSFSEKVYVNTENNEIERTINQQHFITTPTEVETNLSGKRIINTNFSNNVYTLLDSTRGNGIETLSLQNQTNTSSTKEIIDSSNTWGNFNNKIENSVLDVHFGASATYDYFLKAHNRNSIDNKGFKLTNLVHYGQNFVNAYWDGSKMIFGDGDGKIGPLVSLDIIGHEITHGLTSNTAKLLLENESGALNESFSDIFGVLIDFYTRPEKANWTVAEEVSPLIRSLENPSINNDPDTYLGKNWKPIGGSDFGGIHSNNGVHNHWFYLLSNGGESVNDHLDTFKVEGIGISKAAQIAYRNLVYYLTPQSNYNDARLGSIKAAEDLFGSCSDEVESVYNAWFAVGLGEKYNNKIMSEFDISYSNGCDSLTVNFINKSQNAKNYIWDFGDNTKSYEFEPSHTYTDKGVYSVKLISLGDSICGYSDSITKNDLITINFSDSNEQSIIHTTCSLPSTFTPDLNIDTLSTINWYNKNKELINSGKNFTFNRKEDSLIYFERNHFKLGNTNSSLNTAFYNFNVRHLVFDVFHPLIIESVEVNAQQEGNRIFELRDKNGSVILSKTIYLPSGISRVKLNFKVDPGNDYQIGIGGNLIGLSRSNNGLKYPYKIPNLVSIKRSNAQNAGFDFYYFFYNWDVKKINCTNDLFKTQLNLDIEKMDSFKVKSDFNELSLNIDTTKYSIMWYDCTLKNVIGNSNNLIYKPENNGEYTVIVKNNLCNQSDTLSCTNFTSLLDVQKLNSTFKITPNPCVNNLLIINNFAHKEELYFEIKSSEGKTIMIDTFKENIDLSKINSGIYFITFASKNGEILNSTKFIKL